MTNLKQTIAKELISNPAYYTSIADLKYKVKLLKKIKSGKRVEFSYLKKDGSVRYATSKEFDIDENEPNLDNLELVKYYDEYADGFRTFSISRVITPPKTKKTKCQCNQVKIKLADLILSAIQEAGLKLNY